jgi:HlyD family secretion protein
MPFISRNASAIPVVSSTPTGSIADETKIPPQQMPEPPQEWHYGTEELLDALPRAWTRSLLYLLVGFIVVVIPWSMASKIDETGSARGKIEPKGATQKIDSPAIGSVTSVRVKKGENVKAGQVLLELESDVLKSELQQIQAKLEGHITQRSQLELIKNQLEISIRVQEQQNQSQQLEKIAQVNQAKQNLDARESNFNLQRIEKLALVDQAQQNFNSSQTASKLADSRFEKDLSEVERYRPLLQEGAIPHVRLVELEKIAQESQQLKEKSQADVKQAQLRIKEEQSRYQSILNQASADIEQSKLRLQEEESSYETIVNAGKLALLKSQEQFKDLESQISGIQSQIAQTRGQMASIRLQLQQRIVRSPINGIIYELPVTKPGSVLQPGQMVAQIAPKDSIKILKAQIPSNDSGFIKVGMPVKLKFDAYPFQEYGIVPGRVSWISPDSKVQETAAGNLQTYELEIAIADPFIKNGNKRIPLTPGQTASAEIIVRQRRVLDLILDPFKKLQEGGLGL